jgi:hypothetical protein
MQGRRPARLRHSFSARCRVVDLVLSGLSPQAFATSYASTASATSAPAPTRPERTAKPKPSSASCNANGPRATPTHQAATAPRLAALVQQPPTTRRHRRPPTHHPHLARCEVLQLVLCPRGPWKIGRAKIEHGKDAGSPDVGNIGATEDTARRRSAAVRAREASGTEHYGHGRRRSAVQPGPAVPTEELVGRRRPQVPA